MTLWPLWEFPGFADVAASRPVELYSNSVKTFRESNHSYESLMASPRESHPLNGTGSYEENLSTSTRSSPPCTLSNLMKRERDAWEQLRLYLPSQNPNARSEQALNGLQPSDECQRQSSSFSLTEGKNYTTTPSISRDYSQLSTPTFTPKLSYTTNQSVTRLGEDKTSYSPITNTSTVSAKPSCTPTELSTGVAENDRQKVGTVQKRENHPRRTSVVDSMVRTDADSRRRNAITNTYAKDVVRPGMEGPPALPTNSNEVVNGLKPKHLRYNIWDPDSEFTPNTADWTLTARPLEGPPLIGLDIA